MINYWTYLKAIAPIVIQMDFFSKAKKVKTANIELFNFKAICVTYHRCFRPQWNVTYVNFSPSNKKMQKWKFQRSLASEAIIDTQSDPSTQKSANFPQKNIFKLNGEVFNKTSRQITKNLPVKEVLKKTSRLVK